MIITASVPPSEARKRTRPSASFWMHSYSHILWHLAVKNRKHFSSLISLWYCWNTAKNGVKPQSINQSINQSSQMTKPSWRRLPNYSRLSFLYTPGLHISIRLLLLHFCMRNSIAWKGAAIVFCTRSILPLLVLCERHFLQFKNNIYSGTDWFVPVAIESLWTSNDITEQPILEVCSSLQTASSLYLLTVVDKDCAASPIDFPASSSGNISSLTPKAFSSARWMCFFNSWFQKAWTLSVW
jgi:hypothetical protein